MRVCMLSGFRGGRGGGRDDYGGGGRDGYEGRVDYNRGGGRGGYRSVPFDISAACNMDLREMNWFSGSRFLQ